MPTPPLNPAPTYLHSHNARLNAHIISGAVTEEATINLGGDASKLNQARFREVTAALHNKHRPDRSHDIEHPMNEESVEAQKVGGHLAEQ